MNKTPNTNLTAEALTDEQILAVKHSLPDLGEGGWSWQLAQTCDYAMASRDSKRRQVAREKIAHVIEFRAEYPQRTAASSQDTTMTVQTPDEDITAIERGVAERAADQPLGGDVAGLAASILGGKGGATP